MTCLGRNIFLYFNWNDNVRHVFRLLPDSIALLKTVKALQATGDADPTLPLWGAGNPVTEPNASRLHQKADAGASVFLTQPPLAWHNFESWIADAEARGITDCCDVIVGVPMLTSTNHLRMWLQLCGADSSGVNVSAQLQMALILFNNHGTLQTIVCRGNKAPTS